MDLLREKLNKIDHYCIDNDKHFYDLRSLYEAVSPLFTPKDKMELKKVINATNDPAVIQATLQQLQNESYDPEEDYYDDDMYRDYNEDDMYDDWQMGNVGKFNKYSDDLFDEPLPFESLQEAGNYDTGKLNTRINKLKSEIKDIKADWKAGKTKYKKKSSEEENDARDAKRYRAMMAAQKGDTNQSNQKKESLLKEGTMSEDELINAIQNGKSFDFNDYKDYFGTNEPYVELDSKSVKDSDGFLTDYTLYYDHDLGEYICIFGDKELYTPDNSEPDAEFETEREAKEWFDDYNGFEDESFDDIWESLKQINESSLNERSSVDSINAKLAGAIGNNGNAASADNAASDNIQQKNFSKQYGSSDDSASAQLQAKQRAQFNAGLASADNAASSRLTQAKGKGYDPDANPNGQKKQVGQGTVNKQNTSSNKSTTASQPSQQPVQQEQPVQQQPQQQQEQQPAEQPQQQEAPKGPGAGSPNYTELAASGKTNVIGFDQTKNGFGRYKTPNNESLEESLYDEKLHFLITYDNGKKLDWGTYDNVEELYDDLKDFYNDDYYKDCKCTISGQGWSTDLSDVLNEYESNLNESFENSKGLDLEIINCLRNHGYKIESDSDLSYVEEVAYYIEMVRDNGDEDYSAEDWFHDTRLNYPEELNALELDESYKDTLGAAGSAVGKAAAGFFDGPSPVLDLAGGVVGGAIGKTVGGLLDKKNSKNEQLKEDAFDSMTIKSGKVDIHNTFTLDEFDEDDGWFEFEVYPGTYEYRVLDVNGWKPRQIKIDGEWIDVNDKCKELEDLLQESLKESSISFPNGEVYTKPIHYKGYVIKQNRSTDEFISVFDKYGELEDSGFTSIEDAKQYINSLQESLNESEESLYDDYEKIKSEYKHSSQLLNNLRKERSDYISNSVNSMKRSMSPSELNHLIYGREGFEDDVLNSPESLMKDLTNYVINSDSKVRDYDFSIRKLEQIYQKDRKEYLRLSLLISKEYPEINSDDSLSESLKESDDTPWSYNEVMEYLAKETTQGKKKSGTITAYNESEKNDAKKILKRFYKVVEVSDGRTSKDDKMNWVIAYSDPIKKLKEQVNKELYDDLYKYAERHIHTDHWDDSTVKSYLDRQRKLWNKSVVDDTLKKVNKDFKSKKKLKNEPYKKGL